MNERRNRLENYLCMHDGRMIPKSEIVLYGRVGNDYVKVVTKDGGEHKVFTFGRQEVADHVFDIVCFQLQEKLSKV